MAVLVAEKVWKLVLSERAVPAVNFDLLPANNGSSTGIKFSSGDSNTEKY